MDKKNLNITCYFTPEKQTKNSITAHISLRKYKHNPIRVIQQMIFNVDSETSDCNTNLTYSIGYGSTVTGTCSKDYSRIHPGPCSCSFWPFSRNKCIFLVDCSDLMRNLSVSNLWEGRTVESIHLEVRLYEGKLKYLRYFQTNFRCSYEHDNSKICQNLIEDTTQMTCDNSRVTLYACNCINPIQQTSLLLDDKASDSNQDLSWLTSPTLFVRRVYERLATENLGHRKSYHFFILNPSFREPISYIKTGDVIFDATHEKQEFKDSIIKYVMGDVCPTNDKKFDFIIANLFMLPFNALLDPH